jgi:hypothetical protein
LGFFCGISIRTVPVSIRLERRLVAIHVEAELCWHRLGAEQHPPDPMVFEQPRSYYWSEVSFVRQLIGSVHILVQSAYFSKSWPIEESKTPIKIKGRNIVDDVDQKLFAKT